MARSVRSVRGDSAPLAPSRRYVPDSGDICEYLEANFEPKIGASAPPDGVAESLLPSFVAFLKAEAGTAEAAEKEAALVEQLQQLDDFLAGTRPFLAGDSMGGADTILVRPRSSIRQLLSRRNGAALLAPRCARRTRRGRRSLLRASVVAWQIAASDRCSWSTGSRRVR